MFWSVIIAYVLMCLCVWIKKRKRSICELQVKLYTLKLDKVCIDCNIGERLLLYTAQGCLVPVVLISHTAGVSSLRWRINPDKHPWVTTKRKSKISIWLHDGWYQYVLTGHRRHLTIRVCLCSFCVLWVLHVCFVNIITFIVMWKRDAHQILWIMQLAFAIPSGALYLYKQQFGKS